METYGGTPLFFGAKRTIVLKTRMVPPLICIILFFHEMERGTCHGEYLPCADSSARIFPNGSQLNMVLKFKSTLEFHKTKCTPKTKNHIRIEQL